jgi:integrase
MTDTKHADDLERTGDGFFKTRLRYGKGLRGRFLIKLTDEEAAKRRAGRLRELAEMLGAAGHSAEAPIILKKAAAVRSDSDFAEAVRVASELCATSQKARKVIQKRMITFREMGEDWTNEKLLREWPDYVKKKRSVEDDKGRLEFLYKTIGAVPLVRFELADAERAMAMLDAELSSATRRQYAQLISKVLKLAVYPCKIIDRTPLPVGFLPKVKGKKATAFLYPTEDAKLLACQPQGDDPGVPLARRVLYGFLAREGLRLGEAAGLTWADFDLERGVVRLDENKTDDPRTWVLSAGVAAALKAFRTKDTPDGALAFPIEERRAAETFRVDLTRAKVDRTELFDETATRKQIRVHDLRATFVTLALAAGRSEAWVADRTGHKSSTMINRYRRAARTASELDLGSLSPLDEAIPELRQSKLAHGGGPEGGPNRRQEAQKPAEGTTKSSMIPAVPKVGVEPTRLFRTTDFESAASASSATSAYRELSL